MKGREEVKDIKRKRDSFGRKREREKERLLELGALLGVMHGVTLACWCSML
jgi:hypothetical protein